MILEFITEAGTTFAVAQNQKYNGKFHDELIYAEITPFNTGFHLRWSDNFFTPEPFTTLEEAKSSVVREHLSHVPESNGKTWVK